MDGKVISTDAAQCGIECCMKCNRLPECKSVDFADKPSESGLHVDCILFSGKAIGELKQSQEYHHFTRLVGNHRHIVSINSLKPENVRHCSTHIMRK